MGNIVIESHKGSSLAESEMLRDKIRILLDGHRNFERDEDFTIVARDSEDNLFLGGLIGRVHWGWLYVSHLWVSPESRKQLLGLQLIKYAENFAREKKLLGVHLDAFSDFEALEFYKKLGYVEFGRLPSLKPSTHCIFLKKEFSS